MVYFKVSDGEVTRKFKVNPGEITYDQLKERIAALFPKALEGSQSLHLKYRDSDGDLISISTNDEFQEALAELPEDHVWKLHIHGSGAFPYSTQERQASRTNVPSDFFFQPFGSMFGGFSDPRHYIPPYMSLNPWATSRSMLSSLERELGEGHERHYIPPYMSLNPWATSRSRFGQLEKEFDKMLGQHTESLNAMHNAPAESDKPATEGECAMQAQSDGAVAGTSDGKMEVKNFGSWEPKEFDGPFGKGRIIGPVGYYVSWSSAPEGDKKSGEEKAEEKGEDKKSEASTKESTEGMET